MKLYPIPVGYKITYELGGKKYTGNINKVMMPGYKYILTPESNDSLRYCVTQSYSLNKTAIISENMVTDPDIWRLYFDKDYQATQLKLFNEFNQSKVPPLTLGTLLQLLIENKSKLTSQIYIQVDGLDEKLYGIKTIYPRYDKIIVQVTESRGVNLSDLIDTLINLDSVNNRKLRLNVQPGEASIVGLKFEDQKTIFIAKFL